MNSFRMGYKLEAVDDNNNVRVATVAEIFGRVAFLVFDGTERKKFIDKHSVSVFPMGWSEQTKSLLLTPYGPSKYL